MEKCKDCKHWIKGEDVYDIICFPYDDEVGFEYIVPDFEMRFCRSPEVLFYDRATSDHGITLKDGEQYYANMYTAENFGCVNFVMKED